MPEFDKEKYELPSDMADNSKLNKLRAAVLGANDGIVSVSAALMGVAGATTDTKILTLTGLAAVVAGALSMAVGEYVSVSSQSDAEKAYIKEEKADLKKMPEYELDELAREYMKHGLSEKLAHEVAAELTKKNALKAHLRMHFNIDPDDIVNPWHAAISSLSAFTLGGIIPFITIIAAPVTWRIPATITAVVIALIGVGIISARVSNASYIRAIIRVLVGGILAMAITYTVGVIFGTSIG